MNEGNPPRSLVYLAAVVLTVCTAAAMWLLPAGQSVPRLPPIRAAATPPVPVPASASAAPVPSASRAPAAACPASPTPYGPPASPQAELEPRCHLIEHLRPGRSRTPSRPAAPHRPPRP